MEHNTTELLDLSPLGIIVTDKNTRIKWCNSKFVSATGLLKENVIGNLFAALPFEGSGFSNDANKSINLELFNTSENLRKSFQYWQVSSKESNQQRIHYFILQNSISDTTKNKSTTRLPKRASWVEFLDYEVSRSRRYSNPLTLMKCHLLVTENPQQIDEEQIQSCVKNTLMDELRWADMIGNSQQGSYLMVLPETPAESINALKEKLTDAIELELKGISAKLTTSLVFGVAHWQKNDDSSSLLEKARNSLVAGLESLLP